MKTAENYIRYKGEGEHSVRELERIIAQREEELHQIKSSSQFTPSPKEISEEEIEDNAIKRFRFHKDITPSEKTSLKIGFSVGAKWAIKRLSLPSSGRKTEARNKIKDFLLWAWENGWTHEAKETWYKDIPEDKVDEESGLYYTKTHEELFELFIKDKQK